MAFFRQRPLVTLENTCNSGGGSVWPMATLRGVVAGARRHGLLVHLDGARLWNASIAADVPVAAIASHFDSVSVCFSKGLGAPVGSALVGSTELITRARRFRGMLGGAMRQAGVIAAAAHYALDHHREALAVDHKKARIIAEGLAGTKGLNLDPDTVETNIVMLDLEEADAAKIAAACREFGLLMIPMGPRRLRLVTHRDVSIEDARHAFGIIQRHIP